MHGLSFHSPANKVHSQSCPKPLGRPADNSTRNKSAFYSFSKIKDNLNEIWGKLKAQIAVPTEIRLFTWIGPHRREKTASLPIDSMFKRANSPPNQYIAFSFPNIWAGVFSEKAFVELFTNGRAECLHSSGGHFKERVKRQWIYKANSFTNCLHSWQVNIDVSFFLLNQKIN